MLPQCAAAPCAASPRLVRSTRISETTAEVRRSGVAMRDMTHGRCRWLFFFSSRRRHTRYIGDWSSDVCSSDLAGVVLGFVDNAPKGFVQGKDYATIVSDDLFQMGAKAAEAMAAAIGDKGKVGYLFHDANFYVTNQRDQAFKETITTKHPGIAIVAEQGLADPTHA